MKKFSVLLSMVSLLLALFSGCSSEKFPEFQTNDEPAPFDLLNLFAGYPVLDAAWDSVPGGTGNQKLAAMMQSDIPGTAEFMYILSYLMERAVAPGLDLLDDIKASLAFVTDDTERFYGNNQKGTPYAINSFYGDNNAPTYLEDFYGFLDTVAEAVPGNNNKIGVGVIGIMNRAVHYLLNEKTDAELDDFMVDLVETLTVTDDDPADGELDFKADFLDLAEFLSTPVAMADFPMFITEGAVPGEDTLITDIPSMPGGTDSDLGNMAKGLASLMNGFLSMLHGESLDREGMYDLIGNLDAALADPDVTQRLIWNMANYFTAGGSVYGAAVNTTNTNVNANQYNTDNDPTAGLYSNVELKENLSQLLTGASGLFLRDDRRSSMVWYNGTTSQDYPLASLLKNVKNIYMDWDNAQIQESVYDLIRFDALGRDRTIAGSYSASMLEHLLYLGAIAGNTGWSHLADANEIEDSNIFSSNTKEDSARRHGHGEFQGYLTLNDSLFSIMGARDSLASLGTYELLFDGSGVIKGVDQVFRRRTSFNGATADRDNYKFRYTWNYPALQFLSGACVGDFGVSTEGSLHGGNDDGGLGNDQYIPYSANGIYTKDLASWTFSWVIRACWEGEGPYYATQGATRSGNEYTYKRPDGSVYATVVKTDPGDASTWTYTYPVSASYDKADPDDATLRWNRYKAAWNTDYFMIRSLAGTNYVPKDSTGDTRPDTSTNPGYRSYTEMIPEKSAARECASQEEALFRNFQWVMNEKRFAMIIPLWLRNTGGLGGSIESAAYQIIEGNGIHGLSAARIMRDNGVWAKYNQGSTADSSVMSQVPGDYRIIILSEEIQTGTCGLGAVDADKILSLLGNGAATPATIGHNITAISRFGFPRSSLVTSGTNYEHRLLGSRNVGTANQDYGFQLNDGDWTKRNSLLPLFIALLAPLRERSYVADPFNVSANRNALAQTLEGLGALVKPWTFFNYNCDSSGVAANTWLPRVKGGALSYDYYMNHSISLVPDCEISGFSTSGTKGWYGGDSARDYYTPPAMPTLLSVLLDSDTTTNRSNTTRRADGLLGRLMYYDVAAGRPAVTETLTTHTPPDDAAVNSFCYGLEQLTSAMKGARSKGTRIYEDMSGDISVHGYTDQISRVTKGIDPPAWLFQKRVRPDDGTKYIDLDLDDLLNTVIGETASDGLRQYQDVNTLYNDGTGDPDFTDFNETITDLSDLTGDFLVEGAPYFISEHLFDVMDALFQHNVPSEAQVKGLLYTLGKLLAYYDGSDWLFQGGDPGFSVLYDFLTTAVPNIHNEMGLYNGVPNRGTTYRSLMNSLWQATADNGLAALIMETISIGHYSSGDFINELALWLDSDLISGPNTEFYPIMADLLRDMGDLVENSPTAEGLYMLYDYYGFQGY